jgi:hypothetical protein
VAVAANGSIGTRSIEPVARTNTEVPTASSPTSTSSAAIATTTLTPSQLQIIDNAAQTIGQEAAGMSDYQITSGIINAIDATGAFTATEEQAAASAFINPNTGTFSFAATPAQIQSWEQQIESPIETQLSIAALPVVGSGPPTSLVPINPPPGDTPPNAPPPNTPPNTSTTTTGGGTTTVPNINPFLQLFTTWLGSQSPSGSGSGGGSVTDSTGAGDVPGTSTPISSLGAITPIGTPTSTTSSGSDAPLIIGVLLLAAIGGGIWLYERHKKKKGTAPPSPAPS